MAKAHSAPRSANWRRCGRGIATRVRRTSSRSRRRVKSDLRLTGASGAAFPRGSTRDPRHHREDGTLKDSGDPPKRSGSGTACFYFIAGEGFFEALYRTIITISTAGLVGAPQGTDERILTVVLIIWGVAIFLYVFGLMIELAVRGTISGAMQERRYYRRVDRLKGHYIGRSRTFLVRARP
jgi:hypothetical protein